MRKSLPRTPHSGLSSERAHQPVALRRVGAVRHREPKANGGAARGDRRNLQLAFAGGSGTRPCWRAPAAARRVHRPHRGRRLRAVRAAVARRAARGVAIDLHGEAGRRAVAVHCRPRMASCATRWPGSRFHSRTGPTLWSPAFDESRLAPFPHAHSSADRRRRPHTPFEDLAVPRGPARRHRRVRRCVRAAAHGVAAVRAPPRAAVVHSALRTEARSDPAGTIALRRRSKAGTRTLAAAQHHQRGHRSDSADRHRRPADDRERARAHALHRVGRGERRPPRRCSHEQHAAVVGLVEQGDRGDRRERGANCCSSIRSTAPTSCSSCSAPSPRIRGTAPASSRFCAT